MSEPPYRLLMSMCGIAGRQIRPSFLDTPGNRGRRTDVVETPTVTLVSTLPIEDEHSRRY